MSTDRAPGPTGGDGPIDVLVVGVGNEWCGDDGFGPAVAEALSDAARHLGERRVAVQRIHQLAPELAPDVARCRQLVVVDAAVDEPPGRLARRMLGGRAGGDTDLTPAPATPRAAGRAAGTAAGGHAYGPGDLLELVELAYGRRPALTLVVAGVDPAAMTPGTALGEATRALVPLAVAEVLAVLEEALGGGTPPCEASGRA